MKSLAVLSGILLQSIALISVQAQAYGVRPNVNRRLPPQPQRPVAPAAAVPPTPAWTNTTAQTVPPPPKTVVTQVLVRVIQPPVDPVKAKAAKAEALRRTVEFQKQRADEGSESAQYELGIRYLKGEGVEKNETVGRKWLGLSAKAGYHPATIKLDELDRAAQEK